MWREVMRSTKLVKSLIVIAAVIICLGLGLLINSVKVEAASKAKVTLEFTDGTKTTWKTGDEKIILGKKKLAYVYFGSYPQTEVTGKKLTKAITGAKYDKNGVATVKGVKYKRISSADATYVSPSNSKYYKWAGKSYAYFKYEPIKWRVLNVSDKRAFLLAEYGLDSQKYNDEYTNITWENCALRNWLNSDFISVAFTSGNKKLVKSTKLVNNDNSICGTEAGAETIDKVFLLSLDDVVNTKYGFSSNGDVEDINRRAATTAYAKAMGAWTGVDYMTSNGECSSYWFLRSPGMDAGSAAYVIHYGSVIYLGSSVNIPDIPVRPALYLNLSSIIG
ncbi:MAG: DUF6273 domain-containing protein [Lachnospiraceae bacterium]|nr:DUF6273 domain-containing protein [Lachnospiraceae bacterium]